MITHSELASNMASILESFNLPVPPPPVIFAEIHAPGDVLVRVPTVLAISTAAIMELPRELLETHIRDVQVAEGGVDQIPGNSHLIEPIQPRELRGLFIDSPLSKNTSVSLQIRRVDYDV